MFPLPLVFSTDFDEAFQYKINEAEWDQAYVQEF